MKFIEVEKILKKDGWVLVRSVGSHFHYKKEGVDFVATLVKHGSKDLSIGVLKNLEKGTGLSFTNR